MGPPVTAADIDGDPLSYSLFEVDAPFFGIDPDTGQIRVAEGTVMDRSRSRCWTWSNAPIWLEASTPTQGPSTTPLPTVSMAGASRQGCQAGVGGGMAERDMLPRRLLIEVGNDDVLSQTASHRLPGCNLACW